MHQAISLLISAQEGARAPASGRGRPGLAGGHKINEKVLKAGAISMAGAGRGGFANEFDMSKCSLLNDN